MESVPQDILREILLKLPTRDVVRCRCVCKRWRIIVGDPSFKAAHITSGRSEAMLVLQTTTPGRSMMTSVFSVSSAGPRPIYRIVGMSDRYCPANVCSGLLLIVSDVETEPLLVCNPVTCEELLIPTPELTRYEGQRFIMGFTGVSSHEYKIFRIPFSAPCTSEDDNYLDVYTLGGGPEWCRHPNRFRPYAVYSARSPPVIIDGKLYVLTKRSDYGFIPDDILVIDVASEVHCMYHLMPAYNVSGNAAIDLLDLGGRPCVAVYDLNSSQSELHLWVMAPPRLVLHGGQLQLEKKLPSDWERRYTFSGDLPTSYYSLNHNRRGVWIDGDDMLCCVMGYHLYKYDITNKKEHKRSEEHKLELGCLLAWDHELRLPSDGNHQWIIYGGYYPSLLSVRDLKAEPQLDDKEEQFEHSLLRALQSVATDKIAAS